jgi:hypothetical protein
MQIQTNYTWLFGIRLHNENYIGGWEKLWDERLTYVYLDMQRSSLSVREY